MNRTKTIKVKLGAGNYIDWGCRIICKCGHHEYLNKLHFAEDDTWRCDDCDRPILVVSGGVPYYVGLPVFPIEEKWGC